MISDAIDKLDEARDALAKLDQLSECEIRFALVHCVRALRIAKDAEGMTKDRRQQARSAYRMGCAALGMEHG